MSTLWTTSGNTDVHHETRSTRVAGKQLTGKTEPKGAALGKRPAEGLTGTRRAIRETPREGHRRRLGTCCLTLALGASVAQAVPPRSTIDPTPTPAYTTAQVKGEIDPGDIDTYWSFETTIAGENSWSGFNYEGPLPASSGLQPIPATGTQQLSGLKPDTTYEVRLGAINFADPEVFTVPVSFTTGPMDPPTVLSVDNATDVAYTTAKATGEVERPAGPTAEFDASCRFEYVTEAQFQAEGFQGAAQTPCNPNPITAEGPTPVSANLTGLSTPPPTTCAWSPRTPAAWTPKRHERLHHAHRQRPAGQRQRRLLRLLHLCPRSGTVTAGGDDPAFNATTCRFEFVTQAQFEAEGFAAAEPNGQTVGCGVEPERLQARPPSTPRSPNSNTPPPTTCAWSPPTRAAPRMMRRKTPSPRWR